MRNRGEARQLTERDMEIIRWVGRAGIASMDQVTRRFWPGKSGTTATGRVQQLVKVGYLQLHICNMRRASEQVLCMTVKGYALFSPAQQERLQIGLPAPAEVRQQLVAQDAYILLEAHIQQSGGRLAEWRYERELRAELRRKQSKVRHRHGEQYPVDIPDAELAVVTASGTVETLYVEIDGAYYGKMLCEKAGCLARNDRQIIWVCAQERADYVRKALAEYPSIQILVT